MTNRIFPLPKPERHVGDWVVLINKKDPTRLACGQIIEIFMGSLKIRAMYENSVFIASPNYWEVI